MARERTRRDRIVVGVDGSLPSIQALQWALDEAELTGSSVLAVNAWEMPSNWGAQVPVYAGDHPSEAADRNLAQVIDKATTGRKFTQVEQKVVEGHPAKVLLKEAEAADLLVVGNRGHGGFVGALLGSVTQHCIHHATCPVVVIRTTDD